MTEFLNVRRVDSNITNAKRRGEDCADPVNGQFNRAIYALLDALRGESLIEKGLDDTKCVARKGTLVVLTTLPPKEFTRMLNVFTVVEMVAESFNVQPAIVSILVLEQGPKPIDTAMKNRIVNREYYISRAAGICFMPRVAEATLQQGVRA